jgi:hypothetical protein
MQKALARTKVEGAFAILNGVPFILILLKKCIEIILTGIDYNLEFLEQIQFWSVRPYLTPLDDEG